MSKIKNDKSDKKANQPVQKSPKGKDHDAGKNKSSKGKRSRDVSDSPTTEVNPAG